MLDDDQHNIKQQRELLRIHRQNLALYLTRCAKKGGQEYASPEEFHGINDAREQIARIKAHLRKIGGIVTNHPDDEAESTPLSHEQKTRQKLLRKMSSYWITVRLEPTLYFNEVIAPNLQFDPGMLDQPWMEQAWLERISMPEVKALPAGTTLLDIFDEAPDGGLLLLGESGAGKTTLLLSLARTLLERAQIDSRAPIPIILRPESWLNLEGSGKHGGYSWISLSKILFQCSKRMSVQSETETGLLAWLKKSIEQTYDVPPDLLQNWIDHDLVILLIDGLNELGLESQKSLAMSINLFHQEFKTIPLVVCYQTPAYRSLSLKFRFENAIQIQALTQEQIDVVLGSAERPVAHLRTLVHQDKALAVLARSPLDLTLLAMTFDESGTVPLNFAKDEARADLWMRYIKWQLAQHSDIDPEQMRRWLTWLATGLKAHGLISFNPELLGPGWLATQEQQQVLQRKSTVLAMLCMIVATIVAAWISFGSNWATLSAITKDIVFPLQIFMFAIPISLFVLFVLASVVVGTGGSWSIQEPRAESQMNRISLREFFLEAFRDMLGIASIVMVFIGGTLAFFAGIDTGVYYGLICGLAAFIIVGITELARHTALTVKPWFTTGKLDWWQHALVSRAILHGIVVGFSWPLLVFVFFFPFIGTLLLYTVSTKLQLTNAETASTTIPLYFGAALPLMMMVLVLVSLAAGGRKAIEQCLLLWELQSTVSFPKSIAKRCEEAVECSLLQRVDGGYIFRHEKLHEHCAKHSRSSDQLAKIVGPEGDEKDFVQVFRQLQEEVDTALTNPSIDRTELLDLLELYVDHVAASNQPSAQSIAAQILQLHGKLQGDTIQGSGQIGQTANSDTPINRAVTSHLESNQNENE